jgi:hypothetical protein
MSIIYYGVRLSLLVSYHTPTDYKHQAYVHTRKQLVEQLCSKTTRLHPEIPGSHCRQGCSHRIRSYIGMSRLHLFWSDHSLISVL